VAHHAERHPAHEVDVDALMGGADEAARALAFLGAHRSGVPLVYSSADPAAVRDVQARHGTERTAGAVETLFGEIAACAAEGGFRRIVACGGETSGAVVTALRVSSLAVGPEIDPGVPALSTTLADGSPVAVALKSGNFGGTDFIERAARALGHGA
jgi:uncharacterized protein YgbK (DUF1537 family)